ncbi:general odorant-binding protein 83a-like [Athalia rosae]|uniref:general odorant-binding protein 83a-like n=1 Tax=Athalia rosae TaxID=37344 RepID=UPI002033392E|nr:general odorant-binding protein 83a-like [Athalia rosae]
MSYSFVIFVIACLALTVSGELGKDVHYKLRQKCVAEVELEEEAKPLLGTPAFLQHPKARCYFNCFLKGIQVIKEDGIVDAEASLALVDESIREKARGVITKCIDDHQAVPDQCEKSLQIAKCLAEASPGIFSQLGLVEAPKKTE